MAPPNPDFRFEYAPIKNLIGSHREMLATLIYLRQEYNLHLEHLDRVIIRGYEATK